MAKIRDSPGRSDESSGYARLVGNPQLGRLLSKVQSAVIRTGNELEKILSHRARNQTTLRQVLDRSRTAYPEVEVVFAPELAFASGPSIRADILVVDHRTRSARVIELKDGDVFDTKKASGELASLMRFAAEIQQLLGYETTYHFCSFNQQNKSAIIKGAKGRFKLSEVMTGRELCELLGLDYEDILEFRKSEQQENVAYLLDSLLEIDEVRQYLIARLDNPRKLL